MPTATAADALLVEPSPRRIDRLRAAAARPVAADSVAMFRIGFGLLIAFSSARFLAKGWVTSLYVEPANHLTYTVFSWVRPLPGGWMHLHIVVLGLLGLCIAAGYRHRISTALFIVGFVYTELIEASLYLNHYWFMTAAAILLLVLPVHHRWSLDARSGRVHTHNKVASWVVWILRAQLGAVYLFAGLAKLNPDWLFHAQPLRLWLADRTHIWFVGPVLDEPVVAYAASWAGAGFDLTVVGWLLWRRSRPWAYVALTVFHLSTGALFQIGVFPIVMIVLTTIFFDPHWPSRLLPGGGGFDGPDDTTEQSSAPQVRPAVAIAVGVFAVFQILVPLRHYLYPSNVRWSEEGYYLSWRVMLTDKAGHVEYTVTNPDDGRSWSVGPELVLNDWQTNHASTRPDLIHATALLIAEHYKLSGIPQVEVRATSAVSINGGRASQMIDPTVDLAALDRSMGISDWIAPKPQTTP